MPLTESEELELLELENANAAATWDGQPTEKSFLRKASEAVVKSSTLPVVGGVVGC